MSQEHIGLPLA